MRKNRTREQYGDTTTTTTTTTTTIAATFTITTTATTTTTITATFTITTTATFTAVAITYAARSHEWHEMSGVCDSSCCVSKLTAAQSVVTVGCRPE